MQKIHPQIFKKKNITSEARLSLSKAEQTSIKGKTSSIAAIKTEKHQVAKINERVLFMIFIKALPCIVCTNRRFYSTCY